MKTILTHTGKIYGNASIEDMDRQIRTIIEGESVRETDRFNVHFARMGEPTWND